MNLSVIVATRSKPHRAAAVIEVARALASGDHQITYTIAGDLDVAEQFRVIHDHYPWIRTDIAPRPVGVGNCWNRVIASVPADVHLAFADDGFPVTPQWDAITVDVMANHPMTRQLGIFCWCDTANPDQATIFAIGKPWLAIVGHQVFDERFPFWFSDTAINELYQFIAGFGLPMVPSLQVASPSGVFNPRLRDMALWWRLFAATRRERRAIARAYRLSCGWSPEPKSIADILAGCEDRDRRGLPESEEIVRMLLNPASITEEYLIAKANAEAYLAEQETK